MSATDEVQARSTWRQVTKTTSQGFTKAKHLTGEEIEGILDLVAEGCPMELACREYHTSTTQFTRRCRRDPELEKRRLDAITSGREPYQELVRSEVFHQAFVLKNYKALRDLMLMHLPEAQTLGISKHLHANLDPEEFRAMAARQLGELSDADLAAFIEILERSKTGELPAGAPAIIDAA